MLKCMSHPWQNDIGGLLLQTFSLKGFVKKFLEGLFLRVFRHETPYFTRTSSGTEGSASTTSDIALCQFWQNTLMHGAASPLGETAMHSRLPSHAWMHAMHHMGAAFPFLLPFSKVFIFFHASMHACQTRCISPSIFKSCFFFNINFV